MRGWLATAALLVGAFLAFGVLAEAFAPAPQGPAQSSYATSPEGVAAWAELLGRAGHPVRPLREPLASAGVSEAGTLVVLGAQELSGAEVRRLRSFASAGGRLVLGGGDPTRTLPALLSDPPSWATAGPVFFGPVGTAPETKGVRSVKSGGEGAWTGVGGQAALAGGAGASLLIARPYGSGRIVLLADPSPLENRLLASADNAKLALNLGGPARAPVVFAEALHGFGRASGLSAIPGSWWLMFAGLLMAAVLWALSRARRLGPPEPPEAASAPARSAYVTGMAGVLIRTRDRDGIDRLARKLVDSDR